MIQLLLMTRCIECLRACLSVSFSVPAKGSFMYRVNGVDFTTHLDRVRLLESVGVSTVKEFMGLHQQITLYEGVKAVISGYLITLEA